MHTVQALSIIGKMALLAQLILGEAILPEAGNVPFRVGIGRNRVMAVSA